MEPSLHSFEEGSVGTITNRVGDGVEPERGVETEGSGDTRDDLDRDLRRVGTFDPAVLGSGEPGRVADRGLGQVRVRPGSMELLPDRRDE
jgi:hypothetical protein